MRSVVVRSISLCSMIAGLITLSTQKAEAGEWGMLLGYNNPAGSNLGLNFLYQSSGSLGFEVGVGGLYRTTTTTTTSGAASSTSETSIDTWGDIDLKWLPGAGPWRPYLEGGLAFGLGAGSSGSGIAAGSPFVGGGLLYSGRTMLFHITADYKINSRYLYPSAGIGFKF